MSFEGEQRRQAILAAINEHPGLTFRALARATGIPTATLQGHRNILLRRGQAWLLRVEGRLLHFPGTRPACADVVRATWRDALPEGLRELITEALAAGRQADILHAREAPHSTTQHRLSMLARWGFIAPVGAWPIRYQRPQDEGLRAIAHSAWELAHA